MVRSSLLRIGLAIAWASAPGDLIAQDFARPGPVDPSGGSAYLPVGGASGGFIPYQGGPGGGLGVASPSTMAATPARPSSSRAMMGGGSRLGAIRSEVGAAPGRLGGMGGGLIRRGPMPARMARPPVGSYPFRRPPSLSGPGGGSPMTAM